MGEQTVVPFEENEHFNRRERRNVVRSMPRHIRLIYGFGRWRGWLDEMVLRTDGKD